MSDNDNNLEERIKEALDHSIENLSSDTQRQLNRIRIEASELKTSNAPLWKTAGVFSIFFALTLAWQFWPAQSEIPLEPFAEVLQEDLDMLEELEFVYWMAEENEIAAL